MDRSLAVFMRTLQTSSDYNDATSLLPSATSLLVSLSNPLNLQLITSQLLYAPALWENAHDLRACQRIFSVFYTAARQVSQSHQPHPSHTHLANKSPLPLDTANWATAVVKGADEKSPRWRHLLVLGAIHLGFYSKEKEGPSSSRLRSKIELALVTAANLALQEDAAERAIAGYAIAFTLNYTFELLTDFNQKQLNHDLLLPVLVEAVFASREALEQGYWLGIVDQDVVEVASRRFNWSARSTTYARVQEMQQRPLMVSLGSVSRLIAHSVLYVQDSNSLTQVLDRVADFARTLSVAWRQNKLSEVDPCEEANFLDEESIKTTLPTLWHTLRLSLFATIITLKALIDKTLTDPILADAIKAPFLAAQCLYVLRNMYFVASRLGQESSSQYLFVSMVALDLLSQFSGPTEDFVQSIRPVEQGQIPAHPADRCLDLFFFNTVEHLTLSLPPKINEETILASAVPYLSGGGDRSLIEIFEAAHSAALSVLAAPHDVNITSRQIPFYIETLFNCFPHNLSSRQFRLAFKTIVRISSPPSSLAHSQPLLPSILLEIVVDRAKTASRDQLPRPIASPHRDVQEEYLSEQAALILALIDSLCFLHPVILEEWLPLTASAVSNIDQSETRSLCQEHFWEVMSNGIMDVERAGICVTWWNSRGGRAQLYDGDQTLENQYEMSGALSVDSKL